ncbi:Uncharacterised protein [Bordetella pertussis]|nr:Uncharacterised protein [Bordetella pertussis]CRE32725.1 Uncharacterised protein [Bordetella pertussis]
MAGISSREISSSTIHRPWRSAACSTRNALAMPRLAPLGFCSTVLTNKARGRCASAAASSASQSMPSTPRGTLTTRMPTSRSNCSRLA